MRYLRVAAAGITTIGVAGLSLATATVAAQSRTAPEKARGTAARSAQPRTPWGVPDLQGTWSFATVTPLERPKDVTKQFLSPAEIAEIERKIYSRPWTAVLQMTKSEGEIFEYACHEANHAIEGILKGSRMIEQAAEEAARKGSR